MVPVKFLFFYRDITTGGVQRNMLRMSRLLARDGHDVTFVVSKTFPDEFDVPSDINIVRLESPNNFRLILELANTYDTLKPDIVYSAMPNYNTIALLAKSISRRRPKVIISERSHTGAEFQRTGWGFYKLSILLTPIIYRFADVITAVSSETAASLSRFARIPRERIEVVHNPVVSPAIQSLASEEVIHGWLGADFHLVVAVGRLVIQKDYPCLLRAIAILSQKDPKARLLIIGDGPLLPELVAMTIELNIQSIVEFAGFELNPYKWMSKADVFVLQSLWEGLPTVVIEAMACGCTIVATDSPSGPRQILGDNQFGYLVPVSNAQATADALLRAFYSPMDAVTLKREAERYSESASLGKFLSLTKVDDLP